MHKKIPKIYTGCRVSAAKIYLHHSTKIAKPRPHSVEWQTDSSVQKQWFMIYSTLLSQKYFTCEFCARFSYFLYISMFSIAHRIYNLVLLLLYCCNTVRTTYNSHNFQALKIGHFIGLP